MTEPLNKHAKSSSGSEEDSGRRAPVPPGSSNSSGHLQTLQEEVREEIVEIEQVVVEFFGGPVLQQEWVKVDGEEKAHCLVTERHPSWFDLLFDLVLVANFRTLGELVAEKAETDDKPAEQVYVYFLLAFPILFIWQDVMLYTNHYYTGNFADLVYYILCTAGALCVAANLEACDNEIYLYSHTDEAQCKGYAWSVCATRALTFIMRLRAAYYGSVPAQIKYVAVASACLVLLPISAYFETRTLIAVYVLVDFVVRGFATRSLDTLPMPLNSELAVERHGLVVIVALGEVLVNLVQMSMSSSWTDKQIERSVSFIIGGAATAFLLMVMYFHVLDCPGEHASMHAMARSEALGQLWMSTNYPLVLCIALFSGWIEATEVAKESHEADDEHSTGGEESSTEEEYPFTLGSAGTETNKTALTGIAILFVLMCVVRRCSARDNERPQTTQCWASFAKYVPSALSNALLDLTLYPVMISVLVIGCLGLGVDEIDAHETLQIIVFATLFAVAGSGLCGALQHPEGFNSLSDPSMRDTAMTMYRPSEAAEEGGSVAGAGSRPIRTAEVRMSDLGVAALGGRASTGETRLSLARMSVPGGLGGLRPSVAVRRQRRLVRGMPTAPHAAHTCVRQMTDNDRATLAPVSGGPLRPSDIPAVENDSLASDNTAAENA